MINQATNQMNTPPPIIALKHVFGINSNLKNHVYYISENKVLYPAGHNIVILNTDDKSQVYISGADGHASFSCMALSPIKKYLAIAEKGPGIFIYDTTKLGATRKGIKKSIPLQDTPIKDITAINFVPGQEDKYLVFMTGQPDVHLYYYQWDKKKVIASFKIISNYEMTEVAVNPTDPNCITCLGPRIFRGFKLQEGELKIVASQITGAPGNVSQNYTTHTWLSDGNAVVGTSNGELILINKNCEFIRIIDASLVNNCNIECIIPYSKGFIVAGDNFTIYFYEATFDEQTFYTRSKTVVVRNASTEAKEVRITSLSIVPAAETRILCATQNNHIYSTNLKSELQLSDEYVFENLTEPLHFGGINGMDVCVRKPLIVTCGTDCSIRVWNFETFTQECCKFFAEEALSVSIHPSGFHILASFSDRIKMMNIGIKNTLHEEANPNKEYSYIKGCRLVRFSNGGQYFAVVNGGGQNNQYVQIFSTYTGESPKYLILKGHSAKIKSIVWSRDDHYISTCGTDGLVYIWRVSDGQRVSDPTAKIALSCSVLMQDNKTSYAVGKDKTIRKMAENMEIIDAKAMFGQISVTNSNKMIFTGASDENVTSGFIRCYKMPVLTTSAGEYQAHDTQGVEVMRVTVDDQYLITAGKDGVLCVFEIKDKEARAGPKMRDGFMQYANELVVTKKELEDMRNERDNLKGKKSEDTLFQQTEISEKEESIKQLRERQRTLVESEQLKYANLQNTIKETEQKNIEIIDARKKEYESELVELESHHQAEAVKKASAYQKHKEEQERRREEYKKRISEMIDDHNRELRKAEDEYVSKIEEEIAQKDTILQDKQRIQREHEETITQIEDETEREMANLNRKNASEIKNKTDEGLKSKGDVSIAKKKHEQQKKNQADLLENEKEYKMRKDELEMERQQLKDFIEKQKAIISQKDDSISEKEKRIYELKKRTQELEKFKAVLDFKIKELKKDIGPREDEIAKMKEQTNEMDGELKKLSSINNTLGLVVDELDEKQKEMHKNITNQRDTITRQKSRIKQIKDAIYATVQEIQDYNALKTEVEKMKKEYAEHEVKKTDIDPDIYAEYVSQRKYLEKSVAVLKRHLQKDTEMHKQDNLKIMKENVGLIRKINTLRKGIEQIRLSSKDTKENKNGLRPQSVRVGPLKENRDLEETEFRVKEKKKLVEEQKQHLKQLNVKYQTLIAEEQDEQH